MKKKEYKLIRTDSKEADFIMLVQKLDADLAKRDGEEHAFYAQFNKIDFIKHAVVLYINNAPVACGAIKALDNSSAEVKRMYTLPDFRGIGLASLVLKELETWAKELGYSFCMLETGIKQPEAIALYKKSQYQIIENYGQYAGVENSVCFKKSLG